MTTDSSPHSSGANPRVHLVILLILGLVAYANSFSVPFLFDDIPTIVANESIKNSGSFLQFTTWNNNRIIGLLSFTINYQLHGFTVAGYHVINLCIHLLSTFTVYALAIVLLKSARQGGQQWSHDNAGLTAFFSAGFFLAHPIQTQAVTYITQRYTSLATLFYLSSLLCYGLFRLHQKNSRRLFDRHAMVLYSLSLLATILAMRSKEIAFTLPCALVVYEWLFWSGERSSRWYLMIPFLCTLPLIPLSIPTPDILQSGMIGALEKATHIQTTLSRYDYFITECRVIMTYLRLLILPVNQNLDYDYPIYHTFFDPPVMLSAMFLLLCLGCTIVKSFFVPPEKPEQKVVIFGILLFFIGISVESSFIPIVDVIFEHRLYLPSAGIFIAVTCFTFQWLESSHIHRKLFSKAVVLLFSCLLVSAAIATHLRNRVWSSEESLARDTALKSPHKARPLINLAACHIKNNQPTMAIVYLQRALQINPLDFVAWYNMGMALGQLNKFSEAEQMYRTALDLKPDYQNACAYLAWTLEQDGKQEQALVYYKKALTLNPLDSRSQAGLARVASRMAGAHLNSR